MEISYNRSLRDLHTFHTDVYAREFAAFRSPEELRELLSLHKRPMMLLGGGSNVLFTGNFDGLIAKNELRGIALTGEDENCCYVTAQAGENWHAFVQYCISNGYAGVENLSLIPGSVGASPMQNIGAYGVEIKDVFHSLEAMHLKDGTIRNFSLEECQFGYRESVFKKALKDQYAIISVTYRLQKKPVFRTTYGVIAQELEKMGVTNLSIRAVSEAVIRIRSSKLPDPQQIGNAGSFFKNPVISNDRYHYLQQDYPQIPGYPAGELETKVPAGWLIEQCGWKGYRKNDAGCYDKQALVLVNYGNATGQEILDLSDNIMQSVDEKFGIMLEREVNVV